jgi:formylglycine-generating enzyme required for sulfatase activity
MEPSVRDTLAALIVRYGHYLSADPQRCEAMLRDLCGQHRREIAVLIRALKQRVATDLLATSAGLPAPLLLGRLRKRLEDEEAMTAEAAHWAVETWALALGVIDTPVPVQTKPPEPRKPDRVEPEQSKPPPTPQTPTPIPAARSDIPDIHGRSAAEVQAIQQAAAQRLGRSVVFRDAGIQVCVKEQGKSKCWFSDPERIYPERKLVKTVAPPELVVIPAGRFLMGSQPDEPERRDDEGPQHWVEVPAFALGRYAVTFDEWDACVGAGGCSPRPDDQGWGRGKRPVINVSWDDAQQYCQWLSRATGQTYRLPSEAEWEYACRAGTTTSFSTGRGIASDLANCDWNYDENNCAAKTGVFLLRKTQPVGRYPPNPWGLYDMHGNVREWVEDCYNGSYTGVPTDGSDFRQGFCQRRVARGGSWILVPWYLRSAIRSRNDAGHRDNNLGFRVARTLTP